jgi:Domain of unknown function (DUF4136)
MPALIRKAATLGLFAGALAVAAGCAPIRVHAFAEPGATFSFRTYAWASEDAVPTGDPRLDNNRFFTERVRNSVDRELAGRGFEKTEPGSSDLLVHYHATITQDVEIAPTDRADHCYNCGTSVYDAGTLVIDLVDARTSRLVWRGWVEKVDPVIDNQDWMEETIDWAVAQIMKKLPPRT